MRFFLQGMPFYNVDSLDRNLIQDLCTECGRTEIYKSHYKELRSHFRQTHSLILN